MKSLTDVLEAELRDPRSRGAFEDAKARTELVNRLIRFRHAAGLTQRQVAEHMSTTQSAVSDFEAGEHDPYYSTLQRYARAVGHRLETQVKPDAPPRQLVELMRHSTEWQSAAFEIKPTSFDEMAQLTISLAVLRSRTAAVEPAGHRVS